MKILIVDDQELVLLSLEKCLTDLGYEVKSSNNVFDAIAKYDEFLPSLVIADINMPVFSSIRIPIRQLITAKAGLEFKHIKVIKT
jgi:CheY-like chemotaxis protein